MLEPGTTKVHVFDIDDNKVLTSYDADHVPSAVSASPGKRYALLFQRNEGQVQFVDGGIYQSAENNQTVDHKDAPQLLATRLKGARPTHYETHDGLAGLFFDGDAASSTNASFSLLSDASIGTSSMVLAKQTLALPMHGTAEPRGDFMLTTWKAPGSDGSLPSKVELYHRHDDHFHDEKIFEAECPGLHGSVSNKDYTAFGCTDGVLVVQQSGSTFTAKKITNPADMGEGVRISTILGNHHLNRFVGLGSGSNVFEIDPVAGAIKRIDWGEGLTRRAQAVDAEGENLLLLDDKGALHILSTKDWKKRAALPVITQMPTAAPWPGLAVSAEDDKAWVTDVVGKKLHTIDLDDAKIRSNTPLNFAPGALTWVGMPEHNH